MTRWAQRVRQPVALAYRAPWRQRNLLRLPRIASQRAIGLAVAAPAVGADPPPRMPHIRSADRAMLDVLREGSRRSPTFKRFVDEIEQSDLIVYVEATREVGPGMQAYLQLAGANAQLRFLRVVLRIPASAETLIARLGHELEHATEIARAPEVRDQAGLDAFYRRIGDDSGAGWDTSAARSAGNIVLDELHHETHAAPATVTVAATKAPR
jgi:hypothetical protein